MTIHWHLRQQEFWRRICKCNHVSTYVNTSSSVRRTNWIPLYTLIILISRILRTRSHIVISARIYTFAISIIVSHDKHDSTQLVGAGCTGVCIVASSHRATFVSTADWGWMANLEFHLSDSVVQSTWIFGHINFMPASMSIGIPFHCFFNRHYRDHPNASFWRSPESKFD